MSKGHSHSIQGERSWHLENYNLPEHDVDDLKNFPGCEEKQYYDLSEIEKGDHGTQQDYGGGMTETDEDSSGKKDGPYTRINKKRGKYEVVRNKLSATTDMYNSEKPRGIKSPLRGKGRVR